MGFTNSSEYEILERKQESMVTTFYRHGAAFGAFSVTLCRDKFRHVRA
jgi:hypothetical protein